MSYKLDLSGIQREGEVSLTQQLVDRFAAAIETGELEPGEKLPPTRRLATEVGVNHLTAARVYRRLAELGYVTASVGRGTFVRTLAPSAGAEGGDDWQVYALPEHEFTYSERILEEAFAHAYEEGMISLATGWPAPSSYPTAELARITADVFAEEGGEAISYLPPEGLYAMREQIALRGRQLRVRHRARRDRGDLRRAPGDRPDRARPCWSPATWRWSSRPRSSGLLSSLRATGARVIGVPVDDDGMDVDALERLLARHEVKLVALQTASQNPTGRDLSEERRQRLAELAIERNFFLLEDRVYADSRFEGEPGRPLRELAPAHMIYVNSLSKVVGGGLRLGWVAARGPVLERIAMLKLATDFHTPTLLQHIGARFLASGAYDKHVERPPPTSTASAATRWWPRSSATWPGEYRVIKPNGGHHLWVTLERPLDERALYNEAVRHGVTFTPGGAITAERRSQTSLRL